MALCDFIYLPPMHDIQDAGSSLTYPSKIRCWIDRSKLKIGLFDPSPVPNNFSAF